MSNNTTPGNGGGSSKYACHTSSIDALKAPVPIVLAILAVIIALQRPTRCIGLFVYLCTLVVCLAAICINLSLIPQFVACTESIEFLWVNIAIIMKHIAGCGDWSAPCVKIYNGLATIVPCVTIPLMTGMAYGLSIIVKMEKSNDLPRKKVVSDAHEACPPPTRKINTPTVVTASYGGCGGQEWEWARGKQYHLDDSTNGAVVFGDLVDGTINFNHALPRPEVRRDDYDAFQRRARRCP